MKRRIILMALLMGCHLAKADPLLLSDTDMQKLKTYFPASASSEDSAQLTWKGDPLQITLPIGQEKRITFPTHVTVDMKGQLTTDQLRIIDNDKSLYLTAQKAFATTRVYVTVEETHKVILLDLSTDEKASSQMTSIAIPSDNPTTVATTTSTIDNTPIENSDADGENNNNLSMSETDVSLVRYAWQQLYAPTRLVTLSPSINRVPMHTETFVANLVYGDKVMAHPLASWSKDNNYITAIELRNKYPHPTSINVSRDMCGEWVAATIYPRERLSATGVKASDSTTLFLVSKRPFAETMEVCNGHA